MTGEQLHTTTTDWGNTRVFYNTCISDIFIMTVIFMVFVLHFAEHNVRLK